MDKFFAVFPYILIRLLGFRSLESRREIGKAIRHTK